MGGAVANFAALLHMTMHSLTKSAIFFAVGHATQKAGTQLMDGIRGLIKTNPTIGWGLMLGTVAILGVPPFGVFASEFLIITTAMHDHPWATPSCCWHWSGLRVHPQGVMVFGVTECRRSYQPALAGVPHLGLVLMLGLFIPPISLPG
jgi:hydrogenase-4 component F